MSIFGAGVEYHVFLIYQFHVYSEFSAALLSLRPSSSENQGNSF